ncbi:6-bladed beta-propeller [Neobacillus sp. MM2021_6]|uniref:6-bladed beta-propeller n=1 Tax=Bacillaceae TaxID=186817 RepID=UPI00140A121E|nr:MULTISPECIES: 6-bladed beta-propeller [Bacillaceae]MBO0961417.1 6-bladed beta-propeller [Neobacillus sp. MM2021_6]NHC19521.1 6-bladed beta-propeller [Bacillus sp. MM2020_4]
MKKKTLYLSMSAIVVLSVAFFAAIYFFNLQNKVKPYVASIDKSGPPEITQSFYGDFSDPLKKPMDVVKANDYIYVSDASGRKIQVFDQAGTPIFKFGKTGNKEGEFNFPYGIAGDQKGNIYVADLYNGDISIFDAKGKFISYFKEKDEKDKVITSPGGLRIFKDKLYVTDIKQNKVFIFDLSGKKLMEIGGPGNKEGQFVAPNAVTIDKDDYIYVSDSGNNRVQVFDSKGKFNKIINGSIDGKGDTLFLNPRGIAVNSQGTVYIVNSLSHNIYAFDKNGKREFELGGMGTDKDRFNLPNGLFIDNRDTLFVTDTVNQRISEFN